MSRSAPPFAVALAVLAVAAGPVRGVSTSFWRADSFRSFDAGTPAGTSILREGSVVLSTAFDRLELPEAQYVWGAVPGQGDVIYAVTGTPGRLYRIEGSGAEVIFETETADLPVLAVTPAGDIFVGTAPGGEVYRVRDDGQHELFFETGEGYVWSMIYSPAHGLLVGTGGSAKVFAVDSEGEGEIIYESGESTVSALALSGDRVFAGTSLGGLLLEITPGRDLRVLHDSRFEEISAIALDATGRLYFAGATIALEQILDENGEFGAGFGEGSVYGTTDAGGAVELWHSEDEPVTSLGLGPDGSVWAGTGSGGRIYAVGEFGEADLVADLVDDEVLSIVGVGDRTLVTTGLTGAVHKAGPGMGRSGTYESEPLDARAAATWGELAWRAETPGGSHVRLFARSGNTGVPDQTWSDWSPVEGDAEGPIGSPAARFLQWKAELARGSRGASPILHCVEASYLRENLPPRLVVVRVYDPGDIATSPGGCSDGSVSQLLPSGVEVTYSLESTRSKAAEFPALLRGVRTAEWEAVDPNGDPLSFELWMKEEGEEDWKLVEDDLDRAVHTWDSQSMTDGRYRVRIVASDRPGNPPERAATGERASAPFVVDNTCPVIVRLSMSRNGGTLRVEGLVEDLLSPVSRVEVSIDYGEWQTAHADDGMYDSLSESFGLTVDVAGSGERSVAVRAIDRAGNIAVARKMLK